MAGPENIQAQVEGLATLLVLGDEIRKLSTLREFAFFATNETHRLIPYQNAFLWQKKEFIGPTLIMQSGTAEIDVHAPTNQWIKFVISKISPTKSATAIHQIVRTDETLSEITDSWPEELPAFLLWCPLLTRKNELSGGLILFRESAFTENEIKMLTWLVSSYQYTWSTLTKPAVTPSWQKLYEKPHAMAIGIITLAILFFPVHLTVLGTGTVVPGSPIMIKAPMQGVIKTIEVDPGAQVKKGQLLVSMDKTDLVSSLDVNEKSLLLTKTKLRAVINQGFQSRESNAEVPILQSQLAIDESHLDYTKKLLAKADVTSPIDGIAIFDSKEDWTGQPVNTGERILVVADPNQVEVKITIPVPDIIKIEKDYKGDFFLYGHLNPLPFRITTLGYNAKLMPNKILAYQLKGEFIDPQDKPQIGAEGTVKVYGQYVPFFYYLIRRPIQTMRQSLGI